MKFVITIHQALFGYSNGHHLVSSSLQFDSQELKLLESISDLSGTSMPDKFDGYVTGFTLPSKDCYVLSKTWYAKELPRPGCVWTQALFIPFGIQKEFYASDINGLFSRPSTNDSNLEFKYSKPINLEEKLTWFKYISNKETTLAYRILSLLLEDGDPIIIAANSSVEYNSAFFILIKNLGLSFFKNTSFCTGAFSNRSINGDFFTIQIAPKTISKSTWRFINSNGIKETDENNYLEPGKTYYKESDIQDAMKLLSTMQIENFSKQDLKYVADFIQKIHIPNDFSVQEILTASIDDHTIEILSSEAFSQLLLNPNNLTNYNQQINLFVDFCTVETKFENWDKEISDSTLKDVIDNLWYSRNFNMDDFSELFRGELNHLGGRSIEYISTKITLNDFNYLLSKNYRAVNMLIHLNWKLSLCEGVWKQPLENQCDTLKVVAHEYSLSKNLEMPPFKQIIVTIFNNSSENLSERLYKSFNKLAISTFFEWISTSNLSESNKWVEICKYDPITSVLELQKIQSFIAFRQVISVLNPYETKLKLVSIDTWDILYERFCTESMSEENQVVYAQFLLPIILQSESSFPNKLLNFAFLTVHKILAEDNMDYSAWEKLSLLLPEVAWYNMWDKCKRLRKAAKNIDGLSLDFEKQLKQ